MWAVLSKYFLSLRIRPNRCQNCGRFEPRAFREWVSHWQIGSIVSNLQDQATEDPLEGSDSYFSVQEIHQISSLALQSQAKIPIRLQSRPEQKVNIKALRPIQKIGDRQKKLYLTESFESMMIHRNGNLSLPAIFMIIHSSLPNSNRHRFYTRFRKFCYPSCEQMSALGIRTILNRV